MVELHPVDGHFTIAAQMRVGGDTLDVALAAYEHHITDTGRGYPPRPAPVVPVLPSPLSPAVRC